MGQFAAAIRGMAAACEALDFPVVSGNVASTTRPRAAAILPTPAIGGLGVLEDAATAVGLALPPWLDLVLIGATKGWLGQSLWLREIAGREDGAPPPVDLAAERANGDFVRAPDPGRHGARLPRRVRRRRAGRGGGDGAGRRRRRPPVHPPARRPRPRLLVRRGPGPLPARRAGLRRAASAPPRPPACRPCASAHPAGRI